jgi:catalase (peroxidase I)
MHCRFAGPFIGLSTLMESAMKHGKLTAAEEYQFQRELEERLEQAGEDLKEQLKVEFDDWWPEEIERRVEAERERLQDTAGDEFDAYVERVSDLRMEKIEESIREEMLTEWFAET